MGLGGVDVEGWGCGWVSSGGSGGGGGVWGVGLTHSGPRCFEHSFESKHSAAGNDQPDLWC